MAMNDALTIRRLAPADLPAIMRLQAGYAAEYPGVPVIPGEVYLSPGFESGRNVFCAFDAAGGLVGYAPVYPVLVPDGVNAPHKIWAEVRVDPRLAEPLPVKGRLWGAVNGRAREIAAAASAHPSHLVFQYYPIETPSIAYVLAQGCEHTESIFQMARDLSAPIPVGPELPGLDVRRWRMASEAEQRVYVQAHNAAFPDAPLALGDWQYFMQSPQWATGACIAAFDGAEVVGSVTVFEDTVRDDSGGELRVGFTERIFVRPAWRRRGVARHLIGEGLRYLKARNLGEACLEVLAENRQALRLYEDMSYRVARESRLYVMHI
jgi:ribosomal protein S18 acetylase RimI-like enzyme